jgi:hypothetical protein
MPGDHAVILANDSDRPTVMKLLEERHRTTGITGAVNDHQLDRLRRDTSRPVDVADRELEAGAKVSTRRYEAGR